jgi:hypothetical protein
MSEMMSRFFIVAGSVIYIFFFVHGSVHRESVSIIVQQDATLYSFYSLQTALRVSGNTFTHHQERELTVFTASGTDRNVCYLPLSTAEGSIRFGQCRML